MRYKLIGCKIFEREIASVTYQCKNQIDVTLLKQKLHNRPQRLQKTIQSVIDAIDEDNDLYSNTTSEAPFDAILLAYGLCSGAVSGLSSKQYPLVIPRAHDCISLFMGDRVQYEEYYKNHVGTYYYTPGIVELCDAVRLDDQWEQRYYFHLKRFNGNKKKAQKVVEIEKSLTDNYRSLTYIKWDEENFLFVPPKQYVIESYDEDVITVMTEKG